MTTNMTPRETADALTLTIGGQPVPAFTTRIPRGTKHAVSVGRGNAFGLEEVDGLKWVASCDFHGTFVQTRTKAGAMSSTGLDFCQDCRDEVAAEEAEARVLAEGHKARVYVDSVVRGTWAYRCTCGDRDGDYLAPDYARNAWRERNGLEPLDVGLLA